MKVEIFIVTHLKDLPWLHYCLESIRRFAIGFAGTTVLYPEQEAAPCKAVCDAFKVKQITFRQADGRGFNHHQAMVCCADEWCPEAEFILHTDSDCVFTRPVTPADYFLNEKPILCHCNYDHLERFVQANLRMWQNAVYQALKFIPSEETMRRHPAVHYRWLYPEVRAHIEKVQHKPFVEYVLEQRNEFPQGFAEFNTLGAFAWKYHHKDYSWIDLAHQQKPPDTIYQGWSHGGLDRVIDPMSGKKEIDMINAILP